MKPIRKLLVVEDEDVMRSQLAQMCRRFADQVDEAATGDEGLNFIRATRYDLVLSDIRMPGMDGFELLRTVQSMPDGPPVAIMTGHGDMALASDAVRLGAYDYLLKPFSFFELQVLFGSGPWVNDDYYGAALIGIDHQCDGATRTHHRISCGSTRLEVFAVTREVRALFRKFAGEHSDLVDSMTSCVSAGLQEIAFHWNLQVPVEARYRNALDFNRQINAAETNPALSFRRVILDIQLKGATLALQFEGANDVAFENSHAPRIQDPFQLNTTEKGLLFVKSQSESIEFKESGRVLHMNLSLLRT